MLHLVVEEEENGVEEVRRGRVLLREEGPHELGNTLVATTVRCV